MFVLQNLDSSDVELTCNPLYKNGSILLNPCGLIANSFFTGTSNSTPCIKHSTHSMYFGVSQT
jgi:hypothetical protein